MIWINLSKVIAYFVSLGYGDNVAIAVSRHKLAPRSNANIPKLITWTYNADAYLIGLN